MRYILGLLVVLLITACKNEVQISKLKTGTYRAEMEVKDAEQLPFIFEVKPDSTLHIYNAAEDIHVKDIAYKNDSVYITAPVFEGYIAAKIEGDELKGSFINETLGRVVPFEAVYNDKLRFKPGTGAAYNIDGVWETVFSKGVVGDEYVAKGIFKQQDDGKVTGTFRTTTGDYRYLEGVLDGTRLKLSTFDGAHAFYFTAKVTDSTMEGTFYSGNHWKEPFVAKKNPEFELPSANELTYLKEGYDSIEFEFPNTKDEMVTLGDERFKNKVVIVQIMGSWCPNCLDESRYFSEFYKNNKNKDLEFVALAFEYAKTKPEAFKRIERLKQDVGIEYPILLAQYGTSDKAKAQEKLPMLNHVLSYPTSIFIDKTGKVRKIHTGFNGPATGEKYIEFQEEFEGFVEMLLSE